MEIKRNQNVLSYHVKGKLRGGKKKKNKLAHQKLRILSQNEKLRV